jgi:bifunctional oligoribonuclease and PAP phosphatase NrnA
MKTLSADIQAVCDALRHLEGPVAVAVHERPDHDALGAAAAMIDIVTQLGGEALLYVADDEYLPRHGFFLSEGLVRRGTPPAGATLLCVDCGSFERLALPLASWNGTVVNIDHHHDNTRYGDVILVRGEASSTAEILCGLYEALSLTPAIWAATGLYTGISFDSGHFQHASTSAATFACAAWLVTHGVDPTAVYRELYERRQLAALRLWARAVDNVVAVDGGRALLSVLTLADYAAAGAGENDTEAIVESLRSCEGVTVAGLVKEQSSSPRVRVSLRSRGFDVSAVAALRGGGGHRQAAGFTSDDDPREVAQWLSSVLAERLPTASS